MIRAFISVYLPGYPGVLVYMLQATEYQVKPYLAWLHRTHDFTQVAQRRELVRTRPARLLSLALYVGILLELAGGAALIYFGAAGRIAGGIPFGIALVVAYPFLWAYLVMAPLWLGRLLVSKPAEQRLIAASEKIFAKHPGKKIAIAGSYGKTSMKELLVTVLSEGLKVAATPANKNVSISHARFAAGLRGDEDVVVIEYGEGAPGDVARFAQRTHPTHAVITGLAPAHLDRYVTLEAAGRDIFTVADNLKGRHVYVNDESAAIQPFLKPAYETFNAQGALGWRVADVDVSLTGTSFTLKKGRKILKLTSGLVGRHQIGPLAFAAAFGLELELTETQVKQGVARTRPFEHRMQPYQLGGAWVIDDTYNGNLEGIRAGTELLKALPAKRKIYVTPGLVEQGGEARRVHHEMGVLIAAAQPDLVVLMQNSATADIQEGLDEAGFKGEVRVETDPLDFYTNLQHFVAGGDLVLMQNDWTDNYA